MDFHSLWPPARHRRGDGTNDDRGGGRTGHETKRFVGHVENQCAPYALPNIHTHSILFHATGLHDVATSIYVT